MMEKILSEDATKGMRPYEREQEKLKRERNLYKLKNKQLTNEIYKREKILETLETYLIQRIEKLKDSVTAKTAIYELEILLVALKEERNLIFTQEGRK